MSTAPRLRILADHLAHILKRKGGPVSRSDAEAAVRKIVKGSFSKAQFEGAVALAAARGGRSCGNLVERCWWEFIAPDGAQHEGKWKWQR